MISHDISFHHIRHHPLLLLTLPHTVRAQVALFHQLELGAGRPLLGGSHVEGIPVQVDSVHLLQPAEAAGDVFELIVRQADMAELLQVTDGVGKLCEKVDAQVECVEFSQQAELGGDARQPVVAHVQNQQAVEASDGPGQLLQLQVRTVTASAARGWSFTECLS